MRWLCGEWMALFSSPSTAPSSSAFWSFSGIVDGSQCRRQSNCCAPCRPLNFRLYTPSNSQKHAQHTSEMLQHRWKEQLPHLQQLWLCACLPSALRPIMPVPVRTARMGSDGSTGPYFSHWMNFRAQKSMVKRAFQFQMTLANGPSEFAREMTNCVGQHNKTRMRLSIDWETCFKVILVWNSQSVQNEVQNHLNASLKFTNPFVYIFTHVKQFSRPFHFTPKSRNSHRHKFAGDSLQFTYDLWIDTCATSKGCENWG